MTLFEILAAIVEPSVLGNIKKTEAEVYDVNSSKLEKRYHRELMLKAKDHSEAIFTSFLLEHGEYVCPIGGTYHYVDGEVECSEHDDEDDDESDVPFL